MMALMMPTTTMMIICVCDRFSPNGIANQAQPDASGSLVFSKGQSLPLPDCYHSISTWPSRPGFKYKQAIFYQQSSISSNKNYLHLPRSGIRFFKIFAILLSFRKERAVVRPLALARQLCPQMIHSIPEMPDPPRRLAAQPLARPGLRNSNIRI